MKRVIIIGGGFAGSYLAKKLEKFFKVVLIDTKNYFEFTPGILRTIVEPRHLKKIQILHKDYLRNTKIVIGSVSYLDNERVRVKNRHYRFDYLVIASGSKYESPIKNHDIVLVQRGGILKRYHKKLKKSKSILIIGGGLVGVELAAEISTKYPFKKITIIEAGERLMSRNNPKSSSYASYYLRRHGVNIIIGQRVTNFENNSYYTEQGERLKSDMAFLCTGIKPNSEFMDFFFRDKLNEKGYIKVNEFLQLEGFQNIFAIGDVNNIKEEKTAQNAQRQALIVKRNLIRLEKGLPLISYKIKKTPLVISLGKYDGILETQRFVLTGKIPALMKFLIERFEMFKKKF